MRVVVGLLCIALLVAAEEPAPPPTAWTWSGRIGAFMQNTAGMHTTDSRDPSIAGTNDSLSYKFDGRFGAVWKQDRHRLEQTFEADYGRIRVEGRDDWQENADRLAYAITYEHALCDVRFLYGNGTAESVFTGPEPERKPLDPLIAKASAGYGHRYEGLLPERDSLVLRTGIYARKRWESNAPEFQTDTIFGPEVFARYERRQSADVSYEVQTSAYGEFADPGHVTSMSQAGLNVRVTKLLTVEVKARAYYETRPEAADHGEPGYDRLSLRQEAMIGLTWTFGAN